jgi:hypothetical protein
MAKEEEEKPRKSTDFYSISPIFRMKDKPWEKCWTLEEVIPLLFRKAGTFGWPTRGELTLLLCDIVEIFMIKYLPESQIKKVTQNIIDEVKGFVNKEVSLDMLRITYMSSYYEIYVSSPSVQVYFLAYAIMGYACNRVAAVSFTKVIEQSEYGIAGDVAAYIKRNVHIDT